MKTAIIKLYQFNELTEKAKERATNEQIDFLDSIPEESENEDGQMVKEFIEHTTEHAIESIEINEYLFFADGEMAHVTQYTGKHEKSGKIELNFKGEIIEL